MSPRAASLLETLGFEQVYDYVAGKADWGAAGLPLAGRNGRETRAGPTSGPTFRPAVWTSASQSCVRASSRPAGTPASSSTTDASSTTKQVRSEEHTSELQ